MAANQVSCNQVRFENTKHEGEEYPFEINSDQNREVMLSSQSNTAEITNKETHYTTSKTNENSDQTDGINFATGISTLGNILEILDRTENQLKNQAVNLKQNETADSKLGEEKSEKQDFLKNLMTSPYITKILKWSKILIWLIMVVLVLRGLFLGSTDTIINDMNSKSTQKDKSNPVIVNIAPGSSGKQGSDSIGMSENYEGSEAARDLPDFEKIVKMFQYLQKMQPFFAEASIPTSTNKNLELQKENKFGLRSTESLKKFKLENLTFPFK